jgi:hypothetical protein
MFPENYATDVSDVVRVERALSAAFYEHLRSYMAYAVKLVIELACTNEDKPY